VEGGAMTVGEGKFLLYSHITPPLKAGEYRFTTTQPLTAAGPDHPLAATDLGVAPLETYVEVTSPRYQLPPDQVLSTYPPANSEGSYGSRLPQVVIKRRTLPWERTVAGGDDNTPWLALVLIAEGEAELVLNRPVAECVTPGVTLDGAADIAQGAYLSVRKSMIDTVFPTKKDIPLLVHAREVDIHDTELMMGDDDGFLAVVISNRLPVPGRSPEGHDLPVKYLAALVNLEGQLDKLLPTAPPPMLSTVFATAAAATRVVSAATYDHVRMGNDTSYQSISSMLPHDAPHAGGMTASASMAVSPDAVAVAQVRPGHWDLVGATSSELVYAEMAAPFAVAGLATAFLDPTYRFPVLLHWTFTSTGDTTFRTLMEDLDNGLLGTLPGNRPFGEHADDPDRSPRELDGRPQLEVIETGHVGLVQRTRRGDEVRAWYRGPLLPHPADTSAPRLPLAHASDQLRTVIPDGREDLSLAAAFEIGRLLALSNPAMVAALMRWRQVGYQVARRQAVWAGALQGLRGLFAEDLVLKADFGIHLGRGLAQAIAKNPLDVLGQPRAIVDPGTALPVDGRPLDVVTAGLGLREVRGDLGGILDVLRDTQVPRIPLDQLAPGTMSGVVRAELGGALDMSLTRYAVDALAPQLVRDPVFGPTFTGWEYAPIPHRDALDDALDGIPPEGGDDPADDSEPRTRPDEEEDR
jgi:hypothetical protein